MEESGEDHSQFDHLLPQRLFATGRNPKGRLNVYSRPDILSFVQTQLSGTPEWDIIRKSPFGNLYNIETTRCPISCQLIHSLLSRQLITRKKYELWTVFDGQPLRFSLVEFCTLTGLHCGEYPLFYNPEKKHKFYKGKDSTWFKFIGPDPGATLADVSTLLANTSDMPGWRRLGLALILIVDGVLVATRQIHKPTPRYVDMLKDIVDSQSPNPQAFLNFPWGRESFLKTLSTMTPSNNSYGSSDDPILNFRMQLQQQSFSLKGFPLVLQLLALRSIPKLLDKVRDGLNIKTLEEVPFVGLRKHTDMNRLDVLDVEQDPLLIVQPTLQASHATIVAQLSVQGYPNGWAEWNDEAKDAHVHYLEEQISKRHEFTNKEWPGGDASLPYNEVRPSQASLPHKKHVIDRKGKQPAYTARPSKTIRKGKPTSKPTRRSNRKQRRITGYFDRKPDTLDEVITWVEQKHEEQQSIIQELNVAQLLKKYDDEIASLKQKLDKVIQRAKKNEAHLKRIICCGGFGKLSNPRRRLFMRKTPKKTEVHCQGPSSFGTLDTLSFDFSKEPTQGQQSRTINEVGQTSHTVGDLFDYQTSHQDANINTISSQIVDHDSIQAINKQPPSHQADASTLDGVVSDMSPKEVPTPTALIGEPQTSHPFDPDITECFKCQDTLASGQQSSPTIPVPPLDISAEDYSNCHVDHYAAFSEEALSLLVTQINTDADDIGKNKIESPPPNLPELSVKVDVKSPDKEEVNEDAEDTQLTTYQRKLRPRQPKPTSPTLPNKHIRETRKRKLVYVSDESPAKRTTSPTPVYLSDGSPAPKTQTIEPTAQEQALAHLFISKGPADTDDLWPALDFDTFKRLQQYLVAEPNKLHKTETNWDFENKFLIALAKPSHWVDTTHMAVLMDFLGRRHSQTLIRERSQFASPWLMNQLQGRVRSFQKSKDQHAFLWSDSIKKFVTKDQQEWLTDIDTVYVPMNWDNGHHWVGLVINLSMWSIEVLDSNCNLYNDDSVSYFMEGIAQMLPFIIKKTCQSSLSQDHDFTPFTFRRPTGLYQNERGGDCGPVSIKFLEMHAHGCEDDEMGALTDKDVDNFRMQYTMDIFADFIAPLYTSE